jgi:hypothetical protein
VKLLTVDQVAEDGRARLLRRLERELAHGWPSPYRPELELRLERQQLAGELARQNRRHLHLVRESA